MLSMGKEKKITHPSHLVALCKYNPTIDTISSEVENVLTPDVEQQLDFSSGEELYVISETLDWWIFCRSMITGKEGYVPSVYCTPIKLENESSMNQVNADTGFLPKDETRFNMVYFPNAPLLKQNKTCPQEKANILSLITFWWMTKLIVTGCKRSLTDNDLWNLSDDKKASHLQAKFHRQWAKEIHKWKRCLSMEEASDHLARGNVFSSQNSLSKLRAYKPSVTKAIMKAFGLHFIIGSLFKVIHDICQLCTPVLLGKLIQFVQSGDEDSTMGYLYAVILFVVVMLQSTVLHQYFQRVFNTAFHVKSSLTACVYRKMLLLSNTGSQEFTAGEMVNLMSVDIQKCADLLTYLNIVWSGPLQVIVSIVLLYNILGYSVFAGVGILLIVIPLNVFVSSQEKRKQRKQMIHKDLRVKMINEMLSGIKLVKMYAWEESFIEKIMGHRKSELEKLKSFKLWDSGFSFIVTSLPFIVSCATFSLYVFVGNELTAEKAFVAITLFNILRFPLQIMPLVVSNAMACNVAVKRLSKFLKSNELNPTNVTRVSNKSKLDSAIEIKNGVFNWTDNSNSVLKNISLRIPHGSLTAVVGKVGAGKSSLLSALLGEIHKLDGEVTIRGNVAYVAQVPWIQNRILKENILFGEEYNKTKYEHVIKACALIPDLQIFPNGDETEIGENGINLSGGQKQRVAMARAVYSNADIYLLDDPLSAVDANVGNHIFKSVLSHDGLLRNKTRVLVTHNLSFLPCVDQIIVLKDNHIAEVGTYKELLERDGDFAEVLQTYFSNDDKSCTLDQVEIHVGEKECSECTLVSQSQLSISSYSIANDPNEYSNHKTLNGLVGVHEVSPQFSGSNSGLIEKEKSETGRVKIGVFLTYARSIGLVLFPAVVFLAVLIEAFLVGTRLWLVEWSMASNLTDLERNYYVGIYGGLGCGEAISVLLYLFILTIGCISASKLLHKQLLGRILQCPMSFFERTPLGRLLNIFSKDINIIDEALPRCLNHFLRAIMTVVSTIFVIAYSTPIFLAALVPIAIIYILTQRFYVTSSRQLRRMESVRRSPIFNHFLESINGAATIRAFGKSQEFLRDNEQKIDYNMMAYFPSYNADRWLAMRLEFCGNLITFFAALFAIVQRHNISAGLAGLSVSYALQVTQRLNWLVRMTSEMEVNIIAVERTTGYLEAPIEAPRVIEETQSDSDWPNTGVVAFESYSTRYRDGVDFALKDITFTTLGSEKIGVVGRTGAGKSTMALALFRIVEPAVGKIYIDGIDISTLGLRDLRLKLSIIPQDPVLFSGSLRFNLDPFGVLPDHVIWNALEISHLKTFVEGLDNGLCYDIREGGSNLSVGQRQMVCLTRALLRKSRILVLDEATAAVDMETDALIQQTIREQFNDCTIFTIAHRLNTIMDYDRVLVLDEGCMVEFDTPKNLLSIVDGMFYRMAKDSGLVSSK